MKNLKIVLLVSALALCLAVIPVWPYGYYVLLRFIVCGTAAYAIYLLKSNQAFSTHLIFLVIVAVLFNPFIPIHLTRALWLLINLGCAVYFLQLSKKIAT